MLIILAVTAVAVADVLLKKAANSSQVNTLKSPWLYMAIGLYLLQISIFTIAFIAGWKLSIIGALQTALYALIVLLSGAILFHESLTRVQVAGILLAFGGVVLINWP
ncbi:MAG: hypothetical protein NTW32_03415 [Chloroflexi bacterium]|nr:hypothetical protein [Chloroflexota bacterium]